MRPCKIHALEIVGCWGRVKMVGWSTLEFQHPCSRSVRLLMKANKYILFVGSVLFSPQGVSIALKAYGFQNFPGNSQSPHRFVRFSLSYVAQNTRLNSWSHTVLFKAGKESGVCFQHMPQDLSVSVNIYQAVNMEGSFTIALLQP